MSARYGFVIDLRRCIGCDTCVVGCKMENGVPLGQFRLKVYDSHRDPVFERPSGVYPDLEQHWLPSMCQHCAAAPCITACPTRALWRREADGVVMLDKDRCIGCQRCGEECPYDALAFDAELGTADKCSMCEHRIGEDLQPMCALVCPTRAIHFGDLADPASKVRRLIDGRETRRLNEDCGAAPQIHYLAP